MEAAALHKGIQRGNVSARINQQQQQQDEHGEVADDDTSAEEKRGAIPFSSSSSSMRRYIPNADGTITVVVTSSAGSTDCGASSGSPSPPSALPPTSTTTTTSSSSSSTAADADGDRRYYVSWAALLPIDWWASPEDRCLRLLHEYCVRWEAAVGALRNAEAEAIATARTCGGRPAGDSSQREGGAGSGGGGEQTVAPDNMCNVPPSQLSSLVGADTVSSYSTMVIASPSLGIFGSATQQQYSLEPPPLAPSDLRSRCSSLLGFSDDFSSSSSSVASLFSVPPSPSQSPLLPLSQQQRVSQLGKCLAEMLRLRVTRGLLLSVSEAAFSLGSAKLGRLVLQSRLFSGRLLLPPPPTPPTATPSGVGVAKWYDLNAHEFLDTLDLVVNGAGAAGAGGGQKSGTPRSRSGTPRRSRTFTRGLARFLECDGRRTRRPAALRLAPLCPSRSFSPRRRCARRLSSQWRLRRCTRESNEGMCRQG